MLELFLQHQLVDPQQTVAPEIMICNDKNLLLLLCVPCTSESTATPTSGHRWAPPRRRRTEAELFLPRAVPRPLPWPALPIFGPPTPASARPACRATVFYSRGYGTRPPAGDDIIIEREEEVVEEENSLLPTLLLQR